MSGTLAMCVTMLWVDAGITAACALAAGWYAVTCRSYAASILLGFLEARLGLLAHDAAHRDHPVQLLFDFALGSHQQWRARHHHGHHAATNCLDADPDIAMAPFLRVHPQQSRRAFHRHQWWYQWVLFPFIGITLRVSGCAYVYTHETWRARMAHHIRALPAALLHVAYPMKRWGVAGLTHYALTCAVVGWIYGALFSVSHVNDRVEWDADGDRVERQLRSTLDWCPGSAWANWLTVGLNHQSVHHVHPRTPASAYVAMQPTLASHPCYRSVPTFAAAIRANARHLHLMGMPTESRVLKKAA